VQICSYPCNLNYMSKWNQQNQGYKVLNFLYQMHIIRGRTSGFSKRLVSIEVSVSMYLTDLRTYTDWWRSMQIRKASQTTAKPWPGVWIFLLSMPMRNRQKPVRITLTVLSLSFKLLQEVARRPKNRCQLLLKVLASSYKSTWSLLCYLTRESST